MAENFANNYSTALDGAIDASQTTFDVLSVGGAPAVNFRIKVENELMLVTGIATNTFTVTRGIEGTTGATHADGTLVTHVLTAGGLGSALVHTMTLPLRAGNGGDVTINVNTTTYPSAEAWREFRVDFEAVQWTHFRIWTGWASSNAAGQSIFIRLDHNSGGLFSLSGNSDDLTLTNTRDHYATGWLSITRDMSAAGFATLHLSMRGSNSTVDLVFQSLGVSFRRVV